MYKMFTSPLPKVLFLPGVFKSDCPKDDLLEKKVNDEVESSKEINYNIDNNKNNSILYKKVPTTFTCLANWPKSTNILCWHCSLGFEGIPVFIPKAIEPTNKSGNISMNVYGIFCCFGDAVQFVKYSRLTMPEKIKYTRNLGYLYRLLYGKIMNEFPIYPNVYDMHQYGGDISIDDYRKAIHKLRDPEEFALEKRVEKIEY